MIDILPHLQALGTTAQQVADTLDAEGIKGARMRASACPIANYLRDIYPDATTCLVSPLRATVSVSNSRKETGDSVRLPQAITDFINRFDMGKYPNLIEET
jgi:hypothetical protein